jgi:hypothetical protein
VRTISTVWVRGGDPLAWYSSTLVHTHLYLSSRNTRQQRERERVQRDLIRSSDDGSSSTMTMTWP